ncbi:MAG: 4-hydroxythreonine-4-phosphate dehydrogenase PdxA, partial [Bacteroidales bacterium]|nr:4-hydroxythreonine-4-phosphate dehydrogenase PdxA [Bacteroidales bacterium]
MGQRVKGMGLHETTFSGVTQWGDLKGKRPLLWETAETPFAALQQALTHLKSEDLKALLTLPVDAEAVRADCAGFKNTPLWLASQFGGSRPFRMWLLEKWRVTFMTSLRMDRLSERLAADKVRERIESLYRTLQADFNIATPRIALLSMNPDLESAELCEADREVLQPMVAALQESGRPVFGPYAMKTFFAEGRELSADAFHAVLCPYKEQSDWIQRQFGTERLCAYTAGLPFVHMEPVYAPGQTPLETAVRCTARALCETVDICRARALYARLTENPLYASVE